MNDDRDVEMVDITHDVILGHPSEAKRFINSMYEKIKQNEINHGFDPVALEDWAETPRVPLKIALIHSELSEALEAHRNQDKVNFAEELADVAIRLIGLAYGLNVDLVGEILAKMETNESRPVKHGGKLY